MAQSAVDASARVSYAEWQQSPLRLLAHFNVLSAASASLHHMARRGDAGILRSYQDECSSGVLSGALSHTQLLAAKNHTMAQQFFLHLDESPSLVRCVHVSGLVRVAAHAGSTAGNVAVAAQ